MIIKVISFVLLIGGLIHIVIALLNKEVKSPFGKSTKSNLIYGIVLLLVSGILFLLGNGWPDLG